VWTVIGNGPDSSKSDGGMIALSWVSLRNVVTRSLPLNWTTDVRRNPVPFIVNVNCPLPRGSRVGEMLETTGKGLVAVTLKSATFEVEPSGLTTVTGKTPGFARSVPGTTADTLPALK